MQNRQPAPTDAGGRLAGEIFMRKHNFFPPKNHFLAGNFRFFI